MNGYTPLTENPSDFDNEKLIKTLRRNKENIKRYAYEIQSSHFVDVDINDAKLDAEQILKMIEKESLTQFNCTIDIDIETSKFRTLKKLKSIWYELPFSLKANNFFVNTLWMFYMERIILQMVGVVSDRAGIPIDKTGLEKEGIIIDLNNRKLRIAW